MEWIKIFSTGPRPDESGKIKNWTTADLDHVIASYDPAEHEAPVAIGEIKENSPAWAWIGALKRIGNDLYMGLKTAVPEFLKMLKEKIFTKRVVSFYPDFTLRHVGYLGAPPPEIPGLNNIKFSEKEGNIMTYTENEKTSAGERLHRKILEYLESPRAVSKNMTYTEAFIEVCRIERDLAEEYAEELMGSTPKSKKEEFSERYEEVNKKLDVLIREKLRDNPEMTFREAFDKVQLENPELTREYIEFLNG